MKLHINSLVTRLILSFLGLSLITVLAVAYLSYNRARTALTQAVYDRLSATLELKEDVLNNWIDEKMDELLFLRSTPALKDRFKRTLEDKMNARSAADIEVYDVLHSMLINHPDFSEVFLLSTRGGEVLISSSIANEGDFRVSDTYFIEGMKGTFLQNIYLSPVTFRPTITLATPIWNETLETVGVLAAHLDLAYMDRIIFQPSGLGETGEAYLVDSTNTFVAGRGFGRTDYPRGAHSEGIERALEGKSGTGLYKNYAGVAVVGAYRYLPERNLALMAELSQREAFSPARRLAEQILLLGLAVSLFLALATRMVAHMITRPILSVKDAADRISRGDRDIRAPVSVVDEVGDLAKAFNRMVDEIQESEEKLKTIFETIPDAVGIHRLPDVSLVAGNREFGRALGCSLEDLLGKTSPEMSVGIDSENRDQILSMLNKEGNIRDFEINATMGDGTQRTVLVSADAITLDGEPHLLSITKDITKLKVAERAARESEEQFRTTFEQAAVGMAHVALDGRWLRVNDKLCEIFGYTREELHGMTIHDVTHPEDLDDTLNFRDQELRGDVHSFAMEKRYIRKDGSIVWANLTAALLRQDDGSPRHFIEIIQDINDRKIAERALKESEERYRILFNAGSDAVIVCGIDENGLPGKLYTVNDVACRMLGRPYNELTELTVMDLEGGGDPEEIKGLTDMIIDKGQHTFERVFISSNGEEIPVEINANLFDFYETPIIISVARDLTDRKRAEEERKKIQAKLIQANKMTSLGLMVSSLAHEINNPNNTIMFNLRRFGRTWDDALPILKEYSRKHGDFILGGVPFSELATIFPKLMAGTMESSEMIKVIVENLKGFVRHSSDNMDFRVDVNEVVKSSVALLESQVMKGVGRLHLDLQEDIPEIKGNPQKLVQVTVNLISNALEALTEDEQDVVISTSVDNGGRAVVLTVSDRGNGMTKKQLRNVFEPFFSTKLKSGGTGLGLTIAKMLLDEHGARIDIKSVRGKGTDVIVTLNVEEGERVH